eukprot:scaffold48047_cov56-Phaeocystis_antarctica.AAC.4
MEKGQAGVDPSIMKDPETRELLKKLEGILGPQGNGAVREGARTLRWTREPHRRSSSRSRTMVWTAQTSTLGPPLVVEHGDICLGLYGEDSWWPLRVQTDGRAARLGPTVEVVFFGNTQTNRWARNKLRPFSDLHSIPSHSMPKRCAAPGCRVGCARVRDASRPPDGAAFQTAIKEASEWIAAAATIAAAPPPESTSQGVFSSRSVWTGEVWVAEERRHCSQGEELTKDGGVYKQAWTSKEDQSLLQLVSHHGPRAWAEIADKLPGRIGKQCRERYSPSPPSLSPPPLLTLLPFPCPHHLPPGVCAQVAPPRVPLGQHGGVDRGGRPEASEASTADGDQMGQDRNDVPRPHGQRDQEPLELEDAPYPETAAEGRPDEWWHRPRAGACSSSATPSNASTERN